MEAMSLRPPTPTSFGSISSKSPRGMVSSMPLGLHRARGDVAADVPTPGSREKVADLASSQTTSFAAADAEDEAQQLLFFDPRANRVYGVAKSKGVLAVGAFLAFSWVLGVGFLPSLCVLAVLVILAARLFPLGLDENAATMAEQLDNVSTEMIQFFLWGVNSVCRNYLHAAVYVLDIDRAILISLLAVMLVHL
jgi:hypothetical protein